MKKLKFTCPHCEAKLRVPTHLAGVSAPCPKCGETITAPSDITAAVFEPAGVRRAPAQSTAPAAPRPRMETAAPLAAVSAPAPVSTAVMEPPVATASVAPMIPPVTAEVPAPVSRPAPALRSVPAPAALPVPVPAETTVDLAPSAPAVKGSVPPPSVAAPAFFAPPPPVRPLTPPEPGEMEDERSAPPVALEDEADVVVEEQFFDEGPTPPPPAVPITQPIQISALHSDLPLQRETRGGDSLPRLDVSLGGESRTPSPVATADTAAAHGRTRVFLPQPGSNIQPTSPEDFLTPPPPRVLPPVPVQEEPEMEEDFDDGTTPSAEEFQNLAQVELPVTATRYTTIPMPSEYDAIPLDEVDSEPEWETGDEVAAEMIPEPAVPPTLPSMSPPALPEPPSFELPEWSAEPLEDVETLPVSSDPATLWPETETSSVPLQPTLATPVSRRQIQPREESYEEAPANPLHEGSFAKLFAQQAPVSEPDDYYQEPVAEAPMMPVAAPQTGGDELDALFESSRREEREGKGVSKTMIYMIVVVVVVAIGTAIVVAIGIQALGGIPIAQEDQGLLNQKTQSPDGQGFSKPRIPTSSATASAPDLSIKDAPAIIDPPAIPREGAAPAAGDAPALGFEEKVQQMVNGRGASVIGSPSLDIVEKPIADFSGGSAPTPPAPAPPPAPAASAAPAPQTPPAVAALPVAATEGANPLTGAMPAAALAAPGAPEAAPLSAVEAVAGQLAGGNSALGSAPAAPASRVAAVKDPNYNPPDSFPAPGPDDKSTLGKTHDLIDAFLRAPDVETRLKYTYQGESLRAAVEDYHKKWPYQQFDRYTEQLYQVELDTTIGGPYWVFIVATSDQEEGFPFIIRTENGMLKADWQIFAEFSDRQFLSFRDGKVPPPGTFRLILERFTDYYGSDRDAFTDLGDYFIYQVYPPYGESEFSEFVFVKKDSEIGIKLDKLVGIGDEPLAVVVTLDQQAFAHGVKHYVITKLVTEGWFK